jgi:hypothetical protein
MGAPEADEEEEAHELQALAIVVCKVIGARWASLGPLLASLCVAAIDHMHNIAITARAQHYTVRAAPAAPAPRSAAECRYARAVRMRVCICTVRAQHAQCNVALEQ